MKKTFAPVAFAFLVVAAGAIVLAVRSQPAMACPTQTC